MHNYLPSPLEMAQKASNSHIVGKLAGSAMRLPRVSTFTETPPWRKCANVYWPIYAALLSCRVALQGTVVEAVEH